MTYTTHTTAECVLSKLLKVLTSVLSLILLHLHVSTKYGFIEAPYRKIDKETGVVTDEVVYMTADVEDNYAVAQANEPLDENGRFVHSRVVGTLP